MLPSSDLSSRSAWKRMLGVVGNKEMIFLIEYDRGRGRLVRIEPFSDSARKRAEESRLNLELELNLKGIENEVVLVEAASEEVVRRTHSRYFETLAELTATPVAFFFRPKKG